MHKKFSRRYLALPTVALLAALALSGCSSNGGQASGAADSAAAAAPASAAPAASKASVAPKVGEPFTADMGNGNIAKITIVSATYTEAIPDATVSVPAKNGGFLVLDVLWETEKGTTSSNPLYFTAKDANGRKGDFSVFAANQQASGSVWLGDKNRGSVAFDIAPGPAGVIITNQMLQEVARIQFAG